MALFNKKEATKPTKPLKPEKPAKAPKAPKPMKPPKRGKNQPPPEEEEEEDEDIDLDLDLDAEDEEEDLTAPPPPAKKGFGKAKPAKPPKPPKPEKPAKAPKVKPEKPAKGGGMFGKKKASAPEPEDEDDDFDEDFDLPDMPAGWVPGVEEDEPEPLTPLTPPAPAPKAPTPQAFDPLGAPTGLPPQPKPAAPTTFDPLGAPAPVAQPTTFDPLGAPATAATTAPLPVRQAAPPPAGLPPLGAPPAQPAGLPPLGTPPAQPTGLPPLGAPAQPAGLPPLGAPAQPAQPAGLPPLGAPPAQPTPISLPNLSGLPLPTPQAVPPLGQPAPAPSPLGQPSSSTPSPLGGLQPIPNTNLLGNSIPLGTKKAESNFTPFGLPISEDSSSGGSLGTTSEAVAKDILNLDKVKSILGKESLAQSLLAESSSYRDAIYSLEDLEKEIQAIFARSDMTASEKLVSIKQLAFQKSDLQSMKNNILVEKYMALTALVVENVESAAQSRIDSIAQEVQSAKLGEHLIHNSTEIADRISRRTELRTQAHTTLMAIRNIYQIISEEGAEIVNALDEGLPSQVEFINSFFHNSKRIFIPTNTHTLATMILSDIKRDASRFLLLQNKLEDLMKIIFEFSSLDEEAMSENDRIVSILKTNKVENLIVPRNLLQTRLRVYIGPSDTGRTATMITIAGRQSRRGNTLALNLSPNIDLKRYGVRPIPAQELLESKIRRERLFVEEHITHQGQRARVEEIKNCLEEHLGYYNFVDVFLDETQVWVLDILKEYVLAVTFITSTDFKSMKATKEIYSSFKPVNSATHLVIIDAVEELAEILVDLGIDITLTKVINVPHITKMRQYALRGKPPYEDPDIGLIFDDLFR